MAGHRRHSQETFRLVWADLPGQGLVCEFNMSVAENPKELIDAEVEQAEVRVGVPCQVKHDQVLSEAENALHAKVVYRRHLGRDVVVLEMFGHLRELAAFAEAEDGVGLVDADDALATHAEREVAVFVQEAVTRQDRLREPRSSCKQTQHSLLG